MNPTTPTNNTLAMEAFRRMAGQQASSAGIPGGAPVANAQVGGNPLAGIARLMPSVGGAPGPAPAPTQPAMDTLDQSKQGEAEKIVSALIKRLFQLSEPTPTPA